MSEGDFIKENKTGSFRSNSRLVLTLNMLGLVGQVGFGRSGGDREKTKSTPSPSLSCAKADSRWSMYWFWTESKAVELGHSLTMMLIRALHIRGTR